MQDEPYFYHPLENIEDIDDFETAVNRTHLTKSLSPERPYTYWTLEIYDQENGIRGGGGLGVLAADTRRVAEQMGVPFALITPFYPSEGHQKMDGNRVIDEHRPVDYRNFGFKYIDSVNIKCCGTLCHLDVVEKCFRSSRIICITEPNFGELYSGMSGSDHRLYQEVSLGFGGYAALKLLGLKPAIMQLNEVATFFAALARLDELASNGMDFYEAVVYTRKHTLYTNHTLVQAAEAEFGIEQFERFVYPNLKSPAVRKWINDKFVNGKMKLSSVAIEIFYHENNIVDSINYPTEKFIGNLSAITADKVRELKRRGRAILNEALANRPDQNGKILHFDDDEFIFDFKRRFVDYKRPELPFKNLSRLKQILESANAHYILAGRIHTGDDTMAGKLYKLLDEIKKDEFLSSHVHYIADYDEKLAYGLSCGSNAAINVPIVGLEACGTSWMKDIANLNLLISTHDGGVADASYDNYLSVRGSSENDELEELYRRMEEAVNAWQNDFDLEFLMQKQLSAYIPVISGSRMMRDYLDYLFPA